MKNLLSPSTRAPTAERRSLRTEWPGLVLLAVLSSVWVLAIWTGQLLVSLLAIGWVISAIVAVLAWKLRKAHGELAKQAQRSEVERAQRLVLEERARLARDLHDIVAHHMSMIVVQTQSAPYRRPGMPEAAYDELLSVSETARLALSETRVLLSAIRNQETAAEVAPQPGLYLLGELIESRRRAGALIEDHVTGSLDTLSHGRSLAGYRIVQEALSNAARHAPQAPVRVEGHGDAEGVTLVVISGYDAGPALPALPRSEDLRLPWTRVGQVLSKGHGLTGMNERAAAAGGRLVAGPTPDGFLVQVFLPVSDVDTTDE